MNLKNSSKTRVRTTNQIPVPYMLQHAPLVRSLLKLEWLDVVERIDLVAPLFFNASLILEYLAPLISNATRSFSSDETSLVSPYLTTTICDRTSPFTRIP